MFHSAHSSGKGDQPRRVVRSKWDRGYLRAYGRPCPVCNVTQGPLAGKKDDGMKLVNGPEVCRGAEPVWEPCDHCGGIGFVEKNR